ncbi:hypothetical protein AS592_03080 [Sulfurovum riftiae]|uniref:Uncharacterized protein n=1 Tax=Sulfurovum riftiae TaxID=1630136 RepID=A0A151CDZ0_9BACT|nr:hypothetical protein AS592_03080 [Sulfurovum riftiae]
MWWSPAEVSGIDSFFSIARYRQQEYPINGLDLTEQCVARKVWGDYTGIKNIYWTVMVDSRIIMVMHSTQKSGCQEQ